MIRCLPGGRSIGPMNAFPLRTVCRCAKVTSSTVADTVPVPRPRMKLRILTSCLLAAGVFTAAAAPKKLILVTATKGFRHSSIPTAENVPLEQIHFVDAAGNPVAPPAVTGGPAAQAVDQEGR